jgi:hypothetical protein
MADYYQNNHVNKIHTSSEHNIISNEECEVDFMEYYGIIDIVLPPNLSSIDIEKYYKNPNIVILIIESMCLGIFMNLHIARKFKYIENSLKDTEDHEYVYENGMKIVRVPSEWNTLKWSYIKIQKFYKYLPYIDDLSIEELEIKGLDVKRGLFPNFDYNFLESLLWNSYFE